MRLDARLGRVRDQDVPFHHQIYLQLRSEIEDGLWVDSADFPGEVDLAQRFGVSVITSRRALGRLTEEGWIERSRGRRPRVLRRPRPAWLEAPALYPIGALRLYAYELISHGIATGPAQACEAFGLAPGSELWMCSRVRRFDGEPHSVTTNAQLPELGSRHSVKDLRRLPMAMILINAGVDLATMTRRISAAGAPEPVARHLSVPMHSPTLVHTFLLRDRSERPVEWVRIHVRPDRPTPVEVFDLTTGAWTLSEAP
jgi:GntR family transcriptional regulator